MTTKVYKRVYEDTATMIAACDEAFRAWRRVSTAENPEGRAGFIGRHYESWQDVLENANGDWPTGRQIVEEMLEALSQVEMPQPASIRRKARWSEDGGDELDNDRLRSGQEYWRTTRRENLRGPQTVSIIVNVTSPASMQADDILWRGAAGVVLANLLEAAGYRVEFWAVQTASRGYTNGAGCFTALCLKRSEQPLDLGSLVNGVSGWFYRLMFFQAYYVEKSATPCGSLGRPNGLGTAAQDIEELVGNATPVLVENVFDRSAALAKIREVLASLTGDTREPASEPTTTAPSTPTQLTWVKVGDRDWQDTTGRFRIYLDECPILTDTGNPSLLCKYGHYITIASGTMDICKAFAQRVANSDPAALAAVENERARLAGDGYFDK